MRMMKMVYLMLIFLFRKINELSILIELMLCLVKILRWWNVLYIDWIWYEMLKKWYCCAMWCMVNISFYLLIESPAHPLAFFSRFEQIADKAKSTCISIEVIRLGQWIICILLHFEVVFVAIWLPMMLWKHLCIWLVYVGICNGFGFVYL